MKRIQSKISSSPVFLCGRNRRIIQTLLRFLADLQAGNRSQEDWTEACYNAKVHFNSIPN